nr:PREDICTED: trichohyalin-like [Megachile rotundata]XP_012141699.1 PREDICTED: trichohyalin-like [Megachile rotundata]XP_012141700.1 PREDICTED: trichohyalin-like [Megachile rotundata]XP_012141701.1 PREDICTED: trichohyalin-like [Megachile rotundata]
MQNINSRNSLNKNTDATVFCTNAQCQIANEELVNLRQQVSDLKEAVVSLENTIQIKDMQLQNVQRSNERLTAELKKQQRCVRNIKQQLDDEKFFYQREKDYFNSEMQRQKTRCVSGNSKLQQQRQELEDARDSLEEENKSLREELNEKTETTYNLCIKFLRMKYAKDSLRQKFDQLLNEHLQVMADMMEKLDEARGELNIIVSEKFQEPLPLNKAKFLQVVQRNARLVHENAVLKVQIQQLTLNIEKLKSYAQKPKLINVDAKIITKLASQSTKKCSKESVKWPPIQSCENESEKTLFAKFSNQSSVDYSGDGKLLSKIRSNALRKYVGVQEIRTEETWKSQTERAHSAPEILRTEVQPSASTIAQTDSDFRDACTNT